MANWSNPTTGSSYLTLLGDIHDKIVSAAKMFRGSSDTNIPDGVVRFNDTTKKWEKYVLASTSWVDLADVFGISISGDANTVDSKHAVDFATAAQGTKADNALPASSYTPASFATAAQGTKADNALPASNYTAADVMSKVQTLDGSGSGLDADKLDGLDATAFATAAQGTKADNALPATNYTAADVLTKIKTVDGLGSGLDADTVRGKTLDDVVNYNPSVRQTVLSGRTSDGKPNFIVYGAPIFSVYASEADPLIISFAAGFDSKGAVDYIEKVTTTTQLELPGTGNNFYVYADRIAAGNVVISYETTKPTYALRPSAEVGTIGYAQFNISSMIMNVLGTPTQRVYLGEIDRGAATATSYALRGMSETLTYFYDVTGATGTPHQHYLGMRPQDIQHVMIANITSTPEGYSLGTEIPVYSGVYSGAWKGFQVSNVTHLACQMCYTAAGTYPAVPKATGPGFTVLTSGTINNYVYKLRFKRGW